MLVNVIYFINAFVLFVKIADWTSVQHMDKKNYKYQPQFSVGNVGQYAYYHDEDESQFTLVDQSKVVKTSYQKKLRSIQNVSLNKSCLFSMPCLLVFKY